MCDRLKHFSKMKTDEVQSPFHSRQKMIFFRIKLIEHTFNMIQR